MKSQNKKQTIDPAPVPIQRNNLRWIAGFILLIFGLFAVASTFFHFVYWQEDISLFDPASQVATNFAADANPLQSDVENPCGELGAWIGRQLVDQSFGMFGMVLPVMMSILGLYLIRQKPLNFNKLILPWVLVMLFGSLTMGFAFPNVQLLSNTGMGGAFGRLIAIQLTGYIGPIGMIFFLLTGWVLLGVLINRNFINAVNSAGKAVANGGGHLVQAVKDRVEAAREDEDEEVYLKPTPAPVQPAHAEPVVPVEPEEEILPEPDPQSSEVEFEVEHPAEEHTPAEEQPSEEVVEAEEPQAEPQKEPENQPFIRKKPQTSESEFFEEETVRKPQSRMRVEMGPGGMVQLVPVDDGVAPSADPEPVPEPEPEKPAEEQQQTADLQTTDEQPAVAEQPAETPAEIPARQPADATAGLPGVVVDVEEHTEEVIADSDIETDSYDPLKDLINYRKPSVTLLEDYQSKTQVSNEEIFENKTRIEDTLKNFGIPIQKIKATVGPTVTLYEIVQAQGVKISKIQGLENDIAQSLKALGIRIIAPIPGKGTIGIEVPNRDKEVVSMYSCVRSMRFQESKAELPVVIGRTIQNENYVFDLAKMPHLLVAGATGQGKSVGLNAIITSLLYRKHPAQLKFVLIDPKMVEFSLYAKIERHFLAKMESEDEAVVTDPQKAVYTLNALCVEMDNRLELCKKAGTRNIAEYNEKFVARRLNPQKGHRFLPYIVVVVDEFADLIMTAKEVEGPVMRLAQKARAIGIHLIIATQRPDVKVITGGIKANFPARMAFRVMQMIDSRTIIDQPGANQLIGRGDMLFSKDGELTRIQCALVETKEVERVVDYISTQQAYTEPYPLPDYTPETQEGAAMGSEEQPAMRYDGLFAQIARDIVTGGQVSTSMIQRNYEVGFNRAGRIMMQLERAGIVGKQHGVKPRDIMFHDLPSLEAKLQDLGVF